MTISVKEFQDSRDALHRHIITGELLRTHVRLERIEADIARLKARQARLEYQVAGIEDQAAITG